jgi:gamma-glutamyltranspeptidase/glutathione hydrolase
MFNIISNSPSKLRDFDTPRGALLLSYVIQQAFRDRSDRPFDPNFYAQVTKKKMLSPEYARAVARTIRRRIRSQGETTHLSVMDKDGNVVALTQSIERIFGACVATPKLGFLYNNYMMAFEDQNIRHAYYLIRRSEHQTRLLPAPQCRAVGQRGTNPSFQRPKYLVSDWVARK